MKKALLFALLIAASFQPTFAQTVSKYEFRGVWVATVLRLDWPSSTNTDAQKAELVQIFDDLKVAGVNAVVFQVRTESDAFFASETEPWSYWLTGEQGEAPDPFYDPLAFAVEEAHARGLELHAWFNPYRADRGSNYPNSTDHVTMKHPEWILSVGGLKVLDPGLQEVRDYVTGVIADVAQRYDIDGVHFDDYFYPYPPNTISSQDAATFEAFPRGFTNIDDWRRDNVDLLVGQVYDALLDIDPEIVFGISPFGIWKNGVPVGINGLDAYSVIYGDALAWLDAGTVDYLTPQLYWSSQRSFDADGDGNLDFNRQRFTTLAPWWADQAAAAGRHLYPGLGAYRAGGPGYEATEIPTQIRVTRNSEKMQGTILFRANDGVLAAGFGLADTLATDLYRHPALPPIMDWRSSDIPATPQELAQVWDGETVTLTWSPPSSAASDSARFYAVYKIQSATEPNYETALEDARNLLMVTGDTTITDRPFDVGESYYYVVRGVSANSVESPPSNAVVLEGRVVSTEDEGMPLVFGLGQNYPNPFEARTTIGFTLHRPASVTLRVYNVLGQVVATLVDGTSYPEGPHEIAWDRQTDAGQPLASGTYFYRFEAAGTSKTRAMTVLR